MKQDFFSKREELTRHLLDYELMYVEKNCGFSKGSKVKVTNFNGNVEYGFVKGFRRSPCAGVVPVIGKLKKDGSQYKFKEIYVTEFHKIELTK